MATSYGVGEGGVAEARVGLCIVGSRQRETSLLGSRRRPPPHCGQRPVSLLVVYDPQMVTGKLMTSEMVSELHGVCAVSEVWDARDVCDD